MARKNFSEIVCVLDRSGSMEQLVDDTIGGFNSFVKEQKDVDGEANLSLVLFDDYYETPYSNVDIQEVEELTRETYSARGMTALLDALGKSITDLGVKLDNLDEDEKPEHVIFVVMTDGQENASKEYTRQKINEMITHQQDVYNWQFIFMGANIDSFAEAGSIGIRSCGVMDYDADSDGVGAAYFCATSAVSNVRGGGKVDLTSMAEGNE